MSEEFKNEFDENKETETDNVNTQEETEAVFEDNASKPEETTNESGIRKHSRNRNSSKVIMLISLLLRNQRSQTDPERS